MCNFYKVSIEVEASLVAKKKRKLVNICTYKMWRLIQPFLF